MKTPRIILALLPVALLAASSLPRHQAFGQVRFGMTSNDAAAAINHLRHGAKTPMTAAEARSLFVTNGAGMRVARALDFDRACPVYLNYRADPLISAMMIYSAPKTAEGYGDLKRTWEDFQDLGDCKFQRKSPKGEFPPIDKLSPENKEVVTDTWEIEGVRIELSMHYYDPASTPGGVASPGPVRYNVYLTATEIAPPQ